VGGIVIGMIVIMITKYFVHQHEHNLNFGDISGKKAGQMLMFLAIMTIHSATEGIAM
jgi:zinc transporter ZupT